MGIDYFDGVTPTKEISYVYDALGRRVKKIINDISEPTKSFTRKYVYDGNEILAEFDVDNKLLATYTHSTLRTDDALSVDVTADGVNKKVAQTAQSYFYIKDGQGTVVDVVDWQGSKVQHHVYSAFGELVNILDQNGVVVTAAPILAPFLTYTGREYDQESSLYHYRARTYDASIGRFLQVDPHAGKMGYPISVNNKYSYVSNNPSNFTDPSGRFLVGALLGGAFAAIQGDSISRGIALGISLEASIGLVIVGAATGNKALIGAGIGGAIGSINAYNSGDNVYGGFGKGALIGGAVGLIAGIPGGDKIAYAALLSATTNSFSSRGNVLQSFEDSFTEGYTDKGVKFGLKQILAPSLNHPLLRYLGFITLGYEIAKQPCDDNATKFSKQNLCYENL